MEPSKDERDTMTNPTKNQEAALEMARNGLKFLQLFAATTKKTGVKDLNALTDGFADSTGIDRVYIVECVKMYRLLIEANGMKPGDSL